MNYYFRIVRLIESDQRRMQALQAVESLGLPDWLIGAGFVRNAIWDSVYESKTEINDIDVLYFSTRDTSEAADLVLEEALRKRQPDLPWSVKNQARMHLRNGDQPYKNTLDAMMHWPEKQTSIGVMLDNGCVILKHCFDLSFQFNEKINRNPKSPMEVFEKRIYDKQWLKTWPDLVAES